MRRLMIHQVKEIQQAVKDHLGPDLMVKVDDAILVIKHGDLYLIGRNEVEEGTPGAEKFDLWAALREIHSKLSGLKEVVTDSGVRVSSVEAVRMTFPAMLVDRLSVFE